MRPALLALALLFAPLSPARAQAVLGFHFGAPGVSIGVQVPVRPELVQVPGQPVYYAPRVAASYYWFDGLYWVFHGDHWYASAGHDGPWQVVAPAYVPTVVLQVPVRHDRARPARFHDWRGDDSRRWGDHRDHRHGRSGDGRGHDRGDRGRRGRGGGHDD